MLITPTYKKHTIYIGPPIPRQPYLKKPINRRVRVAIKEHDKWRKFKRRRAREVAEAISAAIVGKALELYRQQLKEGGSDA